MCSLPCDLSVCVSSEVHENLKSINADCSKFDRYEVINTYGISSLWSGFDKKVQDFDAVYTVFGPIYLWSISAVSIVGFAQPWIIFPDNEIYRSFSFYERIKVRVKYFVQSFFFRRADRLVVELEHVKSALLGRSFLTAERINIVHNCLNSIYHRPEQWAPLNIGISKKKFSIGFVGRDYPHKNTIILPAIKKELIDFYGLDVNFYVTFNPVEWSAKSDLFRCSVNNVGVLDVAQCPTFYKLMDAIIFPSVLECFSATPLEAMAMEKKLFASDRRFVRDVCGDFACYFDPESPKAAAALIANYFAKEFGRDDAKLKLAQSHVINFSNPVQRALDYLKIMNDATVGRAVR